MSVLDLIYKDISYKYNNSIDILNKFDEFNNNNVTHFNRIQVAERFFKDLQVLIDSRKTVNHYKGVDNINTYRRSNEDEIDFQAMLSEFILSMYLYNYFEEYNREQSSYFKHIKYELPAISEIKLNKFNLDYKVVLNNEELNFDLKSAFYHKNTININKKAFDRINNKLNSFIMVCLIDGKFSDLNSIEYVDYFIVNKKYFLDNSKLVENKAPFLSFTVNEEFII